MRIVVLLAATSRILREYSPVLSLVWLFSSNTAVCCYIVIESFCSNDPTQCSVIISRPLIALFQSCAIIFFLPDETMLLSIGIIAQTLYSNSGILIVLNMFLCSSFLTYQYFMKFFYSVFFFNFCLDLFNRIVCKSETCFFIFFFLSIFQEKHRCLPMLECFLTHMSNILIYVMSSVRPARWPTSRTAFLRGKTLVQAIFFVRVMLIGAIGTIDFYHFVPLSLTLTLAGGHKVSTKQNLLASFSRMLFN